MKLSYIKSPLAGWIGGKSRLLKRIIPLIPPHTCYAEVFAGALWLLLNKAESKCEVANDFNPDVANLFRVLKWHMEEFYRTFKWQLVSREDFERMQALPPESLTDLHRAARFLYIQRCSFGGRVVGPTYGYSTIGKPRFNILRLEQELSDAHIRLARVNIEALPYGDFIQRYDREHTFFYCDPPYYGCEGYYGKDLWSRDDFARLAEMLEGIKGKFLLSINDAEVIRRLFEGFEIREAQTRYTCGKANNTTANELLILNYAPPEPEASPAPSETPGEAA